MNNYDVVVIGGGPIGGYVASQLAEKKIKTALLEEHKEIGMPLKCAGLVTPRIFDLLKISKEKVIQNKIKGANIHSPSGNILSIGGDKIHALVIDRLIFDQEIIKRAESNGTDVFLKNKLTHAKKIKDHIKLKTSEIDLECKLLIGADGPRSKVRTQFFTNEPVEMLHGLGAEVIGTNLDPKFVEVFVGKNIAPGFFAWIIPTNKDGTEARIGLCMDNKSLHPSKYYFSKLFTNTSSSKYLSGAKVVRKIGGTIPLGFLKKTYSSNVLLVGDAAAQVKPTSGGGIYPGLVCAKYCSSVSIEAFEKNDFTEQFLKKYHKLWTVDLGRELSLGMRFRKLFTNLTDDQFDNYIEKFNKPKIADTINEYGDIDFPSKLLKHLLKKAPSLIKLIPIMIKK